ncbi:MAG TPA: M1 family aminopeptidase [Thermoanaerobaculia bacterium]|nr:M1 family aminopeptidase [Thermoanaerobaculia bacterium]
MKRLLLVVLAALAIASLPLSAADTVPGLVEAYDHPTLGKASPVSGATFTSGNLKVTFTQGAAAPVMAGTEQIGVFFKGNGQLEYRSPDPIEAAVLTTNIKTTGLKAEKDGNSLVIRDSFTEVYLLVAGREGLALSGDGDAVLAPAFKEHRDTIQRDFSGPSSFVFVKQKLDAPKTPLVRAQFRGGKEILVYLYDGVLSETEKLYSLHKTRQTSIREYARSHFPTVLSELPIGRTRKDFQDPPFLLYGIDYTLTAETEGAAVLDMTETIIPRKSAQKVYRFNLHDTIYTDNRKERKYNLRRVTDVNGKELKFVHREGEVLVGTPAAMAENEPFTMRFEIDGDFLIRPGGDSYWALGVEPWFPQPELNGQFYTVHSTVKVKKPFVPFAPGTTVRRVVEGDYNVVENKIDKPVQFAIVLAGNYKYEEDVANGVTVRVASYGGANPRQMKKLANLAHGMIGYYEPFLGPFPFTELNVIQINSWGFGQAPPGTMFITNEAFDPLGGDINQWFSQGINHRYAHEIAHQYWGHVVKMGSGDEQWVTESFAEYSSSFVVKELKGNSAHKAMMATWKQDAKDAKDSASIALSNRLMHVNATDNAFANRTRLMYSKGAYLLAQIHKEIGDDKFLTFLRNYQAINAWKFASTKDMVALLKQITGKDYTQFFEENFWGTGMPG